MSVDDTIYMGQSNEANGQACDVGPGITISNNILRKAKDDLPSCLRSCEDSPQSSPSHELFSCLRRSMAVKR